MPAADTTAPFPRLLHPPGEPDPRPEVAALTWSDLALDRVFNRVFGRFHPVGAVTDAVRRPLRTVDEVRYRQEIFRDFAEPGSRNVVEVFAQRVRGALDLADAAAGSHYEVSANRIHLHAVAEYVAAVEDAAEAFLSAEHEARLTSRALTGSGGALEDLRSSAPFRSLADESAQLVGLLDGVRAEVVVRGARFVISAAKDADDVADDAGNVFSRFRDPDASPGGRPDMQVPRLGMDRVQEWVLDEIARLHPQVFDRLAAFRRNTAGFVHPGVRRMVDELVFFEAIAANNDELTGTAAEFSLPTVTEAASAFHAEAAFDVALAGMLGSDDELVTNDLRLDDGERLLVITGPNQGGKTTTARVIGQLHHLAAIGAPVPATNARILLTDQILTQFERGERLESLEGKLGEEVHALHDLLDAATDRTLIVLNEIFTSTAAVDAELLSREVLRRAVAIAPVVVCVTFIDSLARFDEHTVSMVSLIDPADPTHRTFKLERKAADGRAYAQALADKYRLTGTAIAAAVAENTRAPDVMLVGVDGDGDA